MRGRRTAERRACGAHDHRSVPSAAAATTAAGGPAPARRTTRRAPAVRPPAAAAAPVATDGTPAGSDEDHRDDNGPHSPGDEHQSEVFVHSTPAPLPFRVARSWSASAAAATATAAGGPAPAGRATSARRSTRSTGRSAIRPPATAPPSAPGSPAGSDGDRQADEEHHSHGHEYQDEVALHDGSPSPLACLCPPKRPPVGASLTCVPRRCPRRGPLKAELSKSRGLSAVRRSASAAAATTAATATPATGGTAATGRATPAERATAPVVGRPAVRPPAVRAPTAPLRTATGLRDGADQNDRAHEEEEEDLHLGTCLSFPLADPPWAVRDVGMPSRLIAQSRVEEVQRFGAG